MSHPVKAVLFDFGGTLDAAGVAWPERFYSIYRELGLAEAREPFLKAFYRSDDELASRHRLGGLDLLETVRLQAAGVLEALAPSGPRAADAASRVAERFAAESRRHFESQRPALERMRERCRLAVVSNFYGNLKGILAAEGWDRLFDAVADSGEVGALKPDARIFQHALERLGARAEEALMIGDSLGRDMRGAESLGMRHGWLAPAAAQACCPSGRRIAALAEVLPWLEEKVPA